MLLNNVAHYNDLSKELRDKLTERVKSFGNTVRYRFNISQPNPDPAKYNGDTVWPNLYTLDPTRFNINDPYEKREGKSKSKLVSLIDALDERGIPNRFKKVRIHGRNKGILRFDTENNETDFNYVMYLELHPKVKNGMFPDKTKQQLIERIDEHSLATEERELRSARKLAMDTAEKMSDEEVYEFKDAMMWENEDVIILRNKIENLAETTPVLFNDMVTDKKMKYQATIKRAIDNGTLLHNPAEGKLMWASTQQVITMLGIGTGDKNDVERFAEWFMTAGNKADEAFKKITSLTKKEVQHS